LQRASLKDAGVDVSTCPTRTGVASHTSFVFVDRVTGERTIHWHRPLELCLPTDEIDRGVATGGRALLMDADDIDAAIEVAGWARREKTRVMLDVDEPHPRTAELLALVDFAIVSGDFAQRLSGASDLRAALRWMSRLGPRFVAATLGAGGSLAHAKGKTHYQDAFPARTVDTTSAGDVFHAACLYAALRGRQLPQIMSFASTAAGLTCEKLGGRAAIPSLEEIEARL
jgi:sugar/nucleoside kinase (ribokinase family)